MLQNEAMNNFMAETNQSNIRAYDPTLVYGYCVLIGLALRAETVILRRSWKCSPQISAKIFSVLDDLTY